MAHRVRAILLASDCGQLARPALQQGKQPGAGGLASWPGMADHRHSTYDQQLSKPFVAGPADAAQALAAARRMFSGRQAEPRREVASGTRTGRGQPSSPLSAPGLPRDWGCKPGGVCSRLFSGWEWMRGLDREAGNNWG